MSLVKCVFFVGVCVLLQRGCCFGQEVVAAASTDTPSVVLPTQGQIEYQTREIVALIHFNMATFVRDGDPGCQQDNWNKGANCSDPATFNPVLLDTDQWMESITALGAKSAVLTAKHGSGYCLWPTQVPLPTGDPYTYCVGKPASAIKHDVLAQFVQSANKARVGHGFYYSLTNNFYLNVLRHYVSKTPPLPGQIKVTQAQFERIALAQVTELWSNYGNLSEIWFDGGYTTDMKANITSLLLRKQPSAAAFGGLGISPNPVRWVGTESGLPSGPLWSTGTSGAGDPRATQWDSAGCDTTLQNGDHWFWTPTAGIRSLQELIQVYHHTVGSNGVLELDFAIDRDGLVNSAHAARYKEFGDWIRTCYGKPLAQMNSSSSGGGVPTVAYEQNGGGGGGGRVPIGADDDKTTAATPVLELTLPDGAASNVDRVAVRENLAFGQRVLAYEVSARVQGKWQPFASGTAVGNKQIHVRQDGPVMADAFRLNITQTTNNTVPYLSLFAVYAPCPKV